MENSARNLAVIQMYDVTSYVSLLIIFSLVWFATLKHAELCLQVVLRWDRWC